MMHTKPTRHMTAPTDMRPSPLLLWLALLPVLFLAPPHGCTSSNWCPGGCGDELDCDVGGCNGDDLHDVSVDGGRRDADQDAAASDTGHVDGGDASGPDTGAPEYPHDVLHERVAVVDGMEIPYQLLRLERQDTGVLYAMWIPPPPSSLLPGDNAHRGPALLMARPYDGIDWSGEEVDTIWAERPGASAGYRYPDEHGPDYRPGESGEVSYMLSDPDQVVAETLLLHLQGVGVLNIFSRFYAGGTAEEHVQDAVTGLQFLSSNPLVAPDRIAMSGGSWGGFQVIHGATQAPPGVTPAAVVALAPPIDLLHLVQQFDNLDEMELSAEKQAQYEAFFDPFVRRIWAAAGGRPGEPGADYSPYRAESLLPNLQGPVLLIHDDWDTIIPFQESFDFVQAGGQQVEGLWYRRPNPLSRQEAPLHHGPWFEERGVPSMLTFAFGYLFSHLFPEGDVHDGPSIFGAYEWDNTYSYLSHWQQMATSHAMDNSFLTNRLLELSRDRVMLLEFQGEIGPIPVMGTDFVARTLEEVWGVEVPSHSVNSFLQTHGLPD